MGRAVDKRLIKQAFRFELDPNDEQRVLLAKSVGARRYVYNWGLERSQRSYELTGRRPRLGELKAELAQLKKSECPWLYEVSAHIGQQALVDLNAAFERFFAGLKGGGPKSGYPRFKKRGGLDRDTGMGELRRRLAYKCEWYGSRLIVADRFFPSTQLCSECGALNEQLRGFEGLKKRTFVCAACGLLLDRDENAARNLRRYGLLALCGELGIEPLPEGLREVTPVGEEGSGSAPACRAKPTSVKREASGLRARGGTRRGTSERHAGVGLERG